MRDFFKAELKRLHLTTGLQQYFKMSEAELKELLDLLCSECAKFPLIPDDDKKKYIQEFMTSDPEFIGFNKRTIWRWFNLVNKKYIIGQSQHTETETVVPPYAEYLTFCEQEGIVPASEEEYDKPVTTEQIGSYLSKMKLGLGAYETAEQAAANRAAWVADMQSKHGVPKQARARIQEERYQRLWKQECFNEDGSEKDCYMDYGLWKELRFEVKQQGKPLSQSQSKFSESDLTPQATQQEKI